MPTSRLSRPIVWLPLLLGTALVVGILLGLRFRSGDLSQELHVQADSRLDKISKASNRFEELMRYIEARYVDEVNRDELIDAAITQVIRELDPHSAFIPAKDLKTINEQLDGSFDGIGIEFIIIKDTLTVVTPLVGGPSEQAGILAGDQIITVQDTVIAGVSMSSMDIMNQLRGPKGTKVKLGIRRGAMHKLRYFTVERDKIPIESVDVAYRIDEQVAYIKINRFSATTYDEFVEQLRPLAVDNKLEDLIIDLRHNPGGYLQQATRILSQIFKEKEKLLVYTDGRPSGRNDYESSGRPLMDIDDIVVLIDEGSASASEIMAGAIQDQDRGLIVGRRSFGKGLVQEQYSLRDGSALRLTVARYYTPSGRSIQRPYDDDEAYAHDLEQRFEGGELTDTIQTVIVGDSTEFLTRDGHVVYGGGGITPDIYVPLDTTLLSVDYLTLRQHIPTFIFQYKQSGGDRLPGELMPFIEHYKLSTEMLNAFYKHAEQEEGKTFQRTPQMDDDMRLQLKSRLARVLFHNEGFYRVINAQDPMVRKALELLRAEHPLAILKELD